MTEEQIAMLRGLCELRHTVKQISTLMGIPENKVRWQIKKHRLKTVVPWERDLSQAKLIARQVKKFGIKNTAQSFNLTVHTVKGIVRRVRNLGKNLPESYIVQLRKNAYYLALKKGMGQEAADFASFAVIKALEYGDRIDLKLAILNYKNEKYGVYGSEKAKQKHMALDKPLEIGEDYDAGQIQVEKKESVYSDNKIITIANCAELPQIERILFILHYHFGLTHREIGILFDWDEKKIQELERNILFKVRTEVETK